MAWEVGRGRWGGGGGGGAAAKQIPWNTFCPCNQIRNPTLAIGEDSNEALNTGCNTGSTSIQKKRVHHNTDTVPVK